MSRLALNSDLTLKLVPFIVAVSLCLIASAVTASEWYADYDKALKSIEHGEFDSAAKLLERVLSLGPEPGKKVRRYGMNYSSYYPHYYLGKAYFGLGVREKALEMFRTSREMGELADEPELALDREQLLSTADTVTTPPPTEPIAPDSESPAMIDEEASAIETLIDQGKTADAGRKLEELREKVGDSEGPNRERVGKLQNRIERKVAAAGKDLDDGKTFLEVKEYDRAKPSLEKAARVDVTENRARDLLDRLDVEARVTATANAVSEELVAATANAMSEARLSLRRGDLDGAGLKVEAVRSVDPGNSEIKSLDKDLEMARQAERLYMNENYPGAQRRFESLLERDPANRWADRRLGSIDRALARAEDSTSADEIEKTDKSVEDTAGVLKPVRESIAKGEIKKASEAIDSFPMSPNIPELKLLRIELMEEARKKAVNAVREIFKGNRDKAIVDLEDARAALQDRPAVHLYLAWAYYGSYLKGREESPVLMSKAHDALRRALSIDIDFEPNRTLVSPRFGALVEEVRAEVKP